MIGLISKGGNPGNGNNCQPDSENPNFNYLKPYLQTEKMKKFFGPYDIEENMKWNNEKGFTAEVIDSKSSSSLSPFYMNSYPKSPFIKKIYDYYNDTFGENTIDPSRIYFYDDQKENIDNIDSSGVQTGVKDFKIDGYEVNGSEVSCGSKENPEDEMSEGECGMSKEEINRFRSGVNLCK